jgi:hypothetical protein
MAKDISNEINRVAPINLIIFRKFSPTLIPSILFKTFPHVLKVIELL